MLVQRHAGRAREIDGVLSLWMEDALSVRQEGVSGEQDVDGVPHRRADDLLLPLGRRTDAVGTWAGASVSRRCTGGLAAAGAGTQSAASTADVCSRVRVEAAHLSVGP